MKNRGSVTILVLLVATLSVIILGSLVAAVAVHVKSWQRQENGQKAINVAEAGANFLRWRLAHSPEDFQDATRDYYDPQGEKIGAYSVEITPPEEGSTIVTISSTGWSDEVPEIKRTVVAKYGKPSFAQYSFLHNSNVWFGSGISVLGSIHSNGGIRMDGENQSLVTSAKETYTCGSETGCWPPEQKPGVWGSGSGSDLWEYPVTSVDFESVAVDFSSMRQAAQENGIYLAPSTRRGYHLVFDSNGTVTVSEVARTRSRRGWSSEKGCETLNQVIRRENTIGTYSLSENKIIFVEDTVWIDGVVNGKTTVVAASFPIDTSSENIWIADNLTYLAKDGSSALGVIAQQDIYFALHIPETFKIDAVLMAQKGHIIRHFYSYWWVCSYYSDALKDKLEIYGSVISNQKSYWNYGNPPWSGFITREINYDSNLKYAPPPYFPTTGEYEFISWSEN
jgi:hypothetical protein